jgi:hypothetical protein
MKQDESDIVFRKAIPRHAPRDVYARMSHLSQRSPRAVLSSI